MAKKDRLEYGNFEFDDLDFNFDDTPPQPKGSRKSDKPITHIADGVKSALRDKFTDPSHLRSMLRKALPTGFSQAWDAVDTVVDDGRRLYDEATKELRPQFAGISRRLDSMVPESATRAKRFSQYLKDKLDTGESLDNRSSSSFDDQTNQGVERLLADLEGSREANEDHRHNQGMVQEAIRDKVEGKRFAINQQTLGIIARNSQAERKFREGFDISYKKKSLELQYRSYAAMTSLLRNFVEAQKHNLKFQQALLVNTSLPEYAKTTNTQRWKTNVKESVINKANQSLFGKKSRLGMAGDRLMKGAKEKIGDLKDISSMINDALESAADMQDMDKDMAELEGRKSSGWRTSGVFGGSILGDYVSDAVSAQIKKLLEKNPAILKKSFQVGRYAANPGALLDKARKSKRLSKMRGSDSELDNSVADGIDQILSLLRGSDPDMSVKNLSIGSEYEDKNYTQVRTARTVNDVIPGFLSRILREVTIANTGDRKTPLLSYDSKSGRFKSESRMAADIMVNMRKHARTAKVDKDTYSESFSKYAEAFTGKDGVDKAVAPDVKKFLGQLSRSREDFGFTGDGIKQTKAYQTLSGEAKKAVDSILESRFTGDSLAAEGNKYNLATSAAATRTSMSNLTGYIEQAIAEGQGPALIKAGIIRKNHKTDSWDIDKEKYYKLFDDTTEIKSDINVKSNIKSVGKDGKAAINAFKNTGMYTWNYKGSKTPHIGPMAQDVRKNFGEGAAPGGRKIDMVNMNGQSMQAMKHLIEKVESMGAGEGTKHLANIDRNVALLVNRGGGMGGGGQGDEGYYGSGFSGALGALVASGTKAMGRGFASVGRGAGQAAKSAGDMSKTLWDSQKGNLKKAGDAFLATALQAADAAAKFGSRLINETIPSMTKTAKGLGKRIMDQAKEVFQQSKDIMVAGRTSPAISAALLRVGYYRDKVTGKILKTMDDVARATGDIVDGNNETVLSMTDRAKGLYDSSGKKLKSFAGQVGDYLKSGASMAIGLGVDAYDKISAKLKGFSLGGLKDSAARGLNSIRGGMRGFGGIGGDSRVVPVLLQIRDLLALGKRGKAIKEIMGREIDGDRSKYREKKENDPNNIDDSPERVNNSLMAQVRDLLASGKPREAVDEVLGRSKSVGNFLKAPFVGSNVKKFMEKFTGKALGSTASMLPELSGPAPEMVGPTMPGMGSSRSSSGLGGILSSLGGLGKAGKQAGSSLLGSLKAKFPGISGKIGGFKNGRLAGKLSSGKLGRFMGFGKKMDGGLLKGLGSVGGMLGGLLGGSDEKNQAQQAPAEVDGTNTYSAASHTSRLMELGKAGASKAYRSAKGAFGDNDGDGQRDGGTADRMAGVLNAQQANQERKQAGIEASQKAAASKANRYSPADDAIEKMIKVATAGLSSIAGMAGDILGGAADLFGMGGKGGKGGILRKGAGAIARAGSWLFKGAGGLVKGAGAIAKGLGTVGRGVMSVASKVPGSGTVARVAMGATRVAQVVGLAGGGAGSVISGALGVAGSIVSSPVFIGAAALGGVAYGGYKLYKYLTRNSIDDYQRIRILQYGLDGTDATKAFNSKVLGLENYLLDGKLAFSNGTPSINSRAAKIDEIYELFDINKDDSDYRSKFDDWFASRFKPVFLHHVAVLYRVDNKAKLDGIGKLDAPKRLEYLSGADITGVWDYTTSPFKGLDVLSNNPQPSRDLIKALTQTAGKDVNEKAKSKVKAGENNPSTKDAANANKLIESALPDASKALKAKSADEIAPRVPSIPASTKNTNPLNFGDIPKNSRLGKAMANGEVEDGKAPQDIPKSTTMSYGGGTSGLKSASGPLSSGESGMQYLKLGKDAVLDGVHPRLKQHLLSMAQEYGEATGKSIPINEGFRSYERQAALFRKYGPGRAARPGSSLHEYGLALDINSGVMSELEEMGLLRKYGFTRPIRGETWHTEPAGIQQAIQKAKDDPNFADASILSSLGRGGGGFGSTPSSKIGGRNPDLAKNIYEATGGTKVDLKEPKTGAPAAVAQSMPAPVVNGSPAMSDKKMSEMAGPGYASVGRGQDGGSVKSSGNYDASASLGDGTGKHDSVKSEIAKAAKEAGADPNKMMVMAAMESGLDPNAKSKSSSAQGLMQFVDGTWNEQAKMHSAKYNIDPSKRNDVRSQVILGHEYMEQNNRTIRKAAGRDLELVDEYMGHMFGSGGASQLLKSDPNTAAASVLPKAAAANRAIFFDGSRPRTIAEVRQLLDKRLRDKAKEYGINLPGSPVAGGPSSGGPTKAAAASAVAAVASKDPAAPNQGGSGNGPVPYTPSGGAAKPASAERVAGYNLPDNQLPMFTKGDSANKAPGVGFSTSSGTSRAPKGMIGAPTSASIDPQTVVSDILDRFTRSTEVQTTHLANIDEGINAKMVPLLQKIADTISGAPGANKDNQATGKMPQGSSGNAAPRVAKESVDKSSFDNRRSATIV